jgi:hypothetical protein
MLNAIINNVLGDVSRRLPYRDASTNVAEYFVVAERNL